MDVENAPSKKRENSEVRSRATARVLVHAESWQRHPAAAARRWVFVTFLPPRHYAHSPPESKVSLCTPATGRVSGHVEIWQRQPPRPVSGVVGVFATKFPDGALHFSPYFRKCSGRIKIGVFEWNYDSTSGLKFELLYIISE
ncbi:hypothetical protein TNIN_141891 [Trichonephila inaurata madagascariensis]|uniref:Uncharacterized protein n=1 Tax=Trichonephila inaurata madagascariensis TaxID=2747483 RepID=A0A8X6YLG7_9ARAC|nr:hypothetical protein TNIN_141891 [Trichonephila inaurata madagascariensis]